MKLRPYQKEVVQSARKQLALYNRAIVCVPTGGGKTVIFSYIIKEALKKNKTVFVISNRIELLNQAGGTFQKFGIEPYTINASSTKIPEGKGVYNCMVQSLYNRREQAPTPDLIILDEAHLSDHKKIIKYWSNVPILGFTATPISANKKDPLKDWFKGFVLGPSISELINQGYLSPAYQFATDFDASQLDKKGRDYSEKSQTFAFTQKRVILNSFELWRQQASNLKTLAFCASIEHSERMAEEFRMKGVNAYSLTSKNNAQRDYILKEFREGRIQVLFNCGILTTGYDEPSIECILLLRRTKSLPLYMQMCGRGSRIHTNKKHFFILDIAGNFFEHSLRWDDAVDWKTVFQNPKKSIAGVAPQKHCEECEFLFHASLMKCPSCGYEIAPRQAKEVIAELLNISQKDFDRKPEIELPAEVLNDTNLPARISNLRYIKLIRGYKEAWFFRQVWQKHGIQGLRFIEKELDYKKGWSSMMAKRYTTK